MVQPAAAGPRPRVVVSLVATVDGRVSLGRDQRLLDEDVGQAWRSSWPQDVADLVRRRETWIQDHHAPTAVLEGSGTFVDEDAGPAEVPAAESDPVAGRGTASRGDHRWFAVVDGRGRVPWTYTGDDQVRLLVLTCDATPASYLAELRRRDIPYLVTTGQRVDLGAALVSMRSELGVECVVAEGGGGITAALLAAGLVDELHVVTVPALVGGRTTPSLVDGPDRRRGDPVTSLRSIHVEVGAMGSIWAAYDVVR